MTPRAKFWLALTLPLWVFPWMAWSVAAGWFKFARCWVDDIWDDA